MIIKHNLTQNNLNGLSVQYNSEQNGQNASQQVRTVQDSTRVHKRFD